MVVRLSGDLPDGSPFRTDDDHEEQTDIGLLTARFRARIGAVQLPTLRTLHPEVRTLIARAERLEARWSSSSFASEYLSPLKTPRERRRLQFINGLLLIAEQFGQGGYLRTEHRNIRTHLTFGGATVECRVEYETSGAPDTLSVKLHGSDVARGAEFSDTKGSRVEDQLGDIVVEVARIGVDIRRWLDRYDAQLRERLAQEADERKQQEDLAAAAAAEREQRQVAQRRLTFLLRAANNMTRAASIRNMVASVQGFARQQGSLGEDWVKWALAAADSVDPTKNGDLETSIRDHASIAPRSDRGEQ
jgi:hypothetical protein